MPETAAIPKIAATRGYDAAVRLGGSNLAEAVDAALAHAGETGARFIHPYDDPSVIAGQATVGMEIMEQLPTARTVVIPIGGGGLIAGSALAIKSVAPNVRVVGVQIEAAAAYVASRAAGKPVVVDVAPTVADGIAVGRPSDLAFELIEEHVDDIVTVSDDAATRAVSLLLERAKFLVEPSGAVGIAALLAGLVGGKDPVVSVLSGGNIDLLLVGSLVRHGLEVQGRFASFRVQIPDQPGRLAAVLRTVGEAGANVLSADHHREGTGLPLGMVEVRLSVSTRSAEHRGGLVRRPTRRGLRGLLRTGRSPGRFDGYVSWASAVAPGLSYFTSSSVRPCAGAAPLPARRSRADRISGTSPTSTLPRPTSTQIATMERTI